MTSPVRKAVIPAAGLGTRFLPVTKSQPKEMLPVVDKPSIQYVVEEAVRAGLTDILIITGRGKRAIEDHFDRNFELEYYLEQKGSDELLKEVQETSDLGNIHYIRQKDPLGLGHAVSVAREHVGNEPFAVLLGDDIMVDESRLLRSMLDVHDRYGRSVLALMEVTEDQISSYGCVEPEAVEDELVRVHSIVEKPKKEEAPSNLAVIGRYVFTPEIFDALDRIEPGAGGELQLTDAIGLLNETQTVYGRTFTDGRYDIGQKVDFLRANIELALDRPDIGPELERFLIELLESRGLTQRDAPSGVRRDRRTVTSVIPLEDVQAEVLRSVAVLAPKPVLLADALGLVLAEPVVAAEPVPPFANTAMDGYAVRAADTAGASVDAPAQLRVVADLAAGHAATVPVGAGEAIRIMTGAPIPQGVDAIVMVERTVRDGEDGVLVHHAAAAGDHIRAAGGDVVAGQRVFEAGTELGPAHLGVIASLGLESVAVIPRVRVGVLSTGDELREGPVELAPGQIRDSNRPMLLAMLRGAGAEAVNLGIARDDEAYVERAMEDALITCDAVITSGGVSVGDYDVVKAVLDRLGVLQWWQVAIKPAKPFAFGLLRGIPLFGLPGNPVSSHVSFELFARPALRRMSGHTVLHRPEVDAVAANAMPRRRDGKLHLDRVVVRYEEGHYVAERSSEQASNALAAMAMANGLALLPDGEGVAAGETIRVMLLEN